MGGRVVVWDCSPNREPALQFIGSCRANQRSSFARSLHMITVAVLTIAW